MAVGNELELFTAFEAGSVCAVATVHGQDRAREERRLVGSKKGDRLCDFLGLPQSAHWVHPLELCRGPADAHRDTRDDS